jgi:hypothetical protein
MPKAAGVVSELQEITTKDGHVSVGDVLSSTIMFWMHEAVKPHWSVAVHVRLRVPVPMQPFIWLVLSWYVILTTDEKGQVDVAVADPVTAGIGAVLQEMVIVLGQVIVT